MNIVILKGTIGSIRDKQLNTGLSVQLSMATKRRVKMGDGWQDETTWHNCQAYGRLAETINRYFKVGMSILVQGRLVHRKYQDKATGADRYFDQIILDSCEFCDTRSDSPKRQQEKTPMSDAEPNDDVPF